MTSFESKLTILAREANEAHAQAQSCFRSGTEHARRAGRALIKAKAQVAHGDWHRWLAENFDASDRTAQLYMRLVRRWSLLDDETRNAVAEMALRDAVKVVAEPKAVRVTSRTIEAQPLRIVVNEAEPEVLRVPKIELAQSLGPMTDSRGCEATPEPRDACKTWCPVNGSARAAV